MRAVIVSAPRSDPANNHDFLPRATGRSSAHRPRCSKDRCGRLPAARSGEGGPTGEHVVDSPGRPPARSAREFGGARRASSLRARCDQDDAPFLAFGHPYLARKAIDLALDGKQRVDAFDGLQRNRRDSAPGHFLPAARSRRCRPIRRTCGGAWLQHRASMIGQGFRSGR